MLSPPCCPRARCIRLAISSRAASHPIGSNRASPLGPTRRSGWVRRARPWTRLPKPRTLEQMKPAVTGLRSLPSMWVTTPSVTLTSSEHESGQSRGQAVAAGAVAAAEAVTVQSPECCVGTRASATALTPTRHYSVGGGSLRNHERLLSAGAGAVQRRDPANTRDEKGAGPLEDGRHLSSPLDSIARKSHLDQLVSIELVVELRQPRLGQASPAGRERGLERMSPTSQESFLVTLKHDLPFPPTSNLGPPKAYMIPS